ncbi:hypothetical protein LguiA_004470 [Lonicera macranthoides]
MAHHIGPQIQYTLRTLERDRARDVIFGDLRVDHPTLRFWSRIILFIILFILSTIRA